MKKQTPPDNTGIAIVIIILVFAVIIMFFGTHHGNTGDESIMNCLVDGGGIVACFNQ